MGAAWFPKVIVKDTAIFTPVPCSLWHDTFHLGLGRPERTPLASVCRSNTDQGIPSTTVTASHVTQGRVQYETTIPRGTDEGLDLWDAVYVLSEMIIGTFKTQVVVVLFIKLEVCKDLGLVLKAHICSGLGLVILNKRDVI
jgi:hypothetical protein